MSKIMNEMMGIMAGDFGKGMEKFLEEMDKLGWSVDEVKTNTFICNKDPRKNKNKQEKHK